MSKKTGVTEEQVKIFIKYRGDTDYWVRASGKEDRNKLTEDQWNEISKISTELVQLDRGLLSPDYEVRVRSWIENSGCSPSTLEMLKSLP